MTFSVDSAFSYFTVFMKHLDVFYDNERDGHLTYYNMGPLNESDSNNPEAQNALREGNNISLHSSFFFGRRLKKTIKNIVTEEVPTHLEE